MRFFTFDWWRGECDDGHDAVESYWQHFDSIEGNLPVSIRTFARNHNLHDSRLRYLKIDPLRQKAELRSDGWNTQFTEEFVYKLTYLGVQEFDITGSLEPPLGGPGGFGDLGYDEFDQTNEEGYCEHRMLFSTGIEIRLVFKEFEFSYVSQSHEMEVM